MSDNLRKLVRESLYEIEGHKADVQTKVEFDKHTNSPYLVEIAERGLKIFPATMGGEGMLVKKDENLAFPANGRLSWEFLDESLGYNADIIFHLEGQNFELNRNRMQDIKKYKKEKQQIPYTDQPPQDNMTY